VYFNDFWQYDSTTETWTRIADFPGKARYGAVAFSSAGKGYVGLGRDSSGNMNDFYEYNPDNNTWTQIDDFPDNRSGVSFVINDTGYVGTGFNQVNMKSDFYKYESGQWTAIASLLSDDPKYRFRFNYGVYVLNEKGYFLSGEGLNTLLDEAEVLIWEYDPVTNSWEKTGSFITSFRESSSLIFSYVSDNIPYIVSGNAWYKYSSEDNLFYRIGNVSNDSKLRGENIFVINNIPYMTLGYNISSTYNLDLWYDVDAVEKTGIKPVQEENFSIYPNPTTGEFRVSGFEFRVGDIQVFDIYGIKRFSTFNFQLSTQIDISHLPAGIYFVRITTEKGVVTKKIVKK